MGWTTRFAIVALLAIAAAHATEAPDEQVALIATRAADIPTDEELEQRGTRIGRIDIQVEDVFEDSGNLARPYQVANRLHYSTREQTIQQQLLFRSGEHYSRRLLEENERLLRDQRYLSDARIEPVRYHADNTVDLLVRVHDVWTLNPGMSFGRRGGENSSGMEFEDMNFLGRGKQLSLGRSSTVDRTAVRLAYIDPNLFGSWWRLEAAHSSLTDGSEDTLTLQRPFYSLDTRWSAGFSASDTSNAISRYALGEAVESFNVEHRLFEASHGWSAGLRNGWTWRYFAGVRYDAKAFSARSDSPQASIPADHTLAYPWLAMELIEDKYVTTHNFNQIGRTEDLHLGRSARIELGWASSAFGSTHDAAALNTEFRIGTQLSANQHWLNELKLGGRMETGGIANGLMELNSRYYFRQSPGAVFFAGVTGSFASHPDADTQLLLGGDNGLRGYPLRYQGGTASALITLEERFFTNWQPLKLFNVGAAVFFDAGRTWGNDAFAGPSMGWLKDAGIGLRLGTSRSSLGNVVHIDLALPLDGGNDISRTQLLIQTKRSF